MIFKNLFSGRLGEELGIFFASGYGKMFLERPYDELFKTVWGQRLKGLGIGTKNGLALASGLGFFFLQRKLASNTALTQFFREVTADAWPELAKRLLNGWTDFLTECGQQAKTTEAEQMVTNLKQVSPEDIALFAQQYRSALLDSAVDQIKQWRSSLQKYSQRRSPWWSKLRKFCCNYLA